MIPVIYFFFLFVWENEEEIAGLFYVSAHGTRGFLSSLLRYQHTGIVYFPFLSLFADDPFFLSRLDDTVVPYCRPSPLEPSALRCVGFAFAICVFRGFYVLLFWCFESPKGNLACCVTLSLRLATGLCVIRYSDLVVVRFIVECVLLAIYLSVDIILHYRWLDRENLSIAENKTCCSCL